MRGTGNNNNARAHQYPIARNFACTILIALILLIILRQVFGSVHLEVGSK